VKAIEVSHPKYSDPKIYHLSNQGSIETMIKAFLELYPRIYKEG
jgi:hypothetical protein